MKFLIVTCVHEMQDEVKKIFQQSGIYAFSATEVTGFKGEPPVHALQEWFASGDEQFDSMMLFSFTTAENVAAAMEKIRTFNKEKAGNFPLRAFVMPVEQTI
ncbi:MAG: hypothetical protein JST86_01680 [Bacteroidetes bacterium]|nr:hypothetical protein [Bacteroidota bacterium]